MKTIRFALLMTLVALMVLIGPPAALAQEENPPAAPLPELTVVTPYPSQVIGLGETADLDLELSAGSEPQTVQLEMDEIPADWTATFRGGGRIVQAVYVGTEEPSEVELRLEPPDNVEPGAYRFVVLARGESAQVELPIQLTVQEKLPPSLSFEIELPTLRGTPSTTFRYSTTLKNEGDEDMTVNLIAEAPENFLVTFRLTGQEVTNLPLSAGESKSLSIEAEPLTDIPAGSYPITVTAQGSEAQATLELLAEVAGQPQLEVTAPEGRLSGQAYAGRETPISVILRNNGSSPAFGIELSSSAPSGWTVTFEPSQVAELPAGEQVEITANLQPAEKAIAGDYMLTITATPAEGASKSAEFRISVLTSTLWGVVGVALVAISLGVVALAVVRFGRR